MDREFNDELTGLMPCVLHGITGVDCTGRVVAVVEDTTVELRCDKCGAVVGVVQAGIMEGLLGLDSDEVECPHCGKVNTFATIQELVTYVCSHCGGTVDAERTEDFDSK
jgi:DNA-directed RNA polymerase subunit RPC12/RpoP